MDALLTSRIVVEMGVEDMPLFGIRTTYSCVRREEPESSYEPVIVRHA